MKYLWPLLFLVAPTALADIPLGVDIILLGEVHDNPDAHLGQAQLIEELKPTAVVFEMFTPQDAQKANSDRDTIPEIWATMSWPDFEVYRPIFDTLGNAVIVGAATSRDTIGKVYANGAASVFGPEATQYGLDVGLPPVQQAKREDLQFAAHCDAMPRDLMSGMVEVQRFRDAQFAKAAIEALEAYGSPVVVITGNGHARTDWGIPAYIRSARPDVTTYSIAFLEGQSGAAFDDIRIVPQASLTCIQKCCQVVEDQLISTAQINIRRCSTTTIED